MPKTKRFNYIKELSKLPEITLKMWRQLEPDKRLICIELQEKFPSYNILGSIFPKGSDPDFLNQLYLENQVLIELKQHPLKDKQKLKQVRSNLEQYLAHRVIDEPLDPFLEISIKHIEKLIHITSGLLYVMNSALGDLKNMIS